MTLGRDTVTSYLGRTGMTDDQHYIAAPTTSPGAWSWLGQSDAQVRAILTIFFEVEASGGLLVILVPDGDDVTALSGLWGCGVREV